MTSICVLLQVLDRNVEHLSGGELQRFAIAVVAAQKADVYMIDEPSSYLDVRQRLHAAKVCGDHGIVSDKQQLCMTHCILLHTAITSNSMLAPQTRTNGIRLLLS